MRLSRADCTSAMEVKETVFFEYKRMHAQGVVVGVERMGCACKHASARVLDVTQIPALGGDAGSIGFVDPRFVVRDCLLTDYHNVRCLSSTFLSNSYPLYFNEMFSVTVERCCTPILDPC